MSWNVQNWIETVKAKPEHIRYRYLFGCVTCSMFFVVIIWSLTVSENFKSTVANTETNNPTTGLLPRPSDFSLDQILSGEEVLDVAAPKSSEEFLREQEENRQRLDPATEGVLPKDEKQARDEEILREAELKLQSLNP